MRARAAALGTALVFLAGPCVVAGVIPWWITRWEVREPLAGLSAGRPIGAGIVIVGLAVLVTAFARFVVEGQGTPAPVAPTERLVVGGLYRYVRNPMYLAVVAIILGQALLLGQPALVSYSLLVWLVFAAFVRLYEEPTLRRRYGAQYDSYRRGVRAWLPRARPWSDDR